MANNNYCNGGKRKNMRIAIHIYSLGEIVPKYAGYIQADQFDAEECWHLCNWTQWAEQKPVELHSEIGCCSHGICFTNPETKEKWLALTSGWLVGDIVEISEYVRKNKGKVVWIN